MGESSTLATHNVSTTVLPQPALSLVVEDEDEPPSSGPGSSGAPEINFDRKAVELSTQTITHGFQDCVRRDQGASPRVASEISAPEARVYRTRTVEMDVEKLEATDEPISRRGGPRGSKPSVMRRFLAALKSKQPAGPRPTYYASFVAAFRYTPINILLVCIPISWALHYTHQSPTLIFVFSGLGIVPLAALLGLGTEQIALSTTQSIGGLLNASLGNLIEMIIAGIALKKCELEVVQSTLLGGLLSNLLLVLGCSFIVGGFRFQHQQFQAMVAQLNSSLLIVSVISMTIPAAFHQFLESRLVAGTEVKILLELSRGTAIILILMYLAYLFFQFYSHNHLFLDTTQERTVWHGSSGSKSSAFSRHSTQTLPTGADATLHRSRSASRSSSEGEEIAKLNNPAALILLVVVTALAYVTSDYLVDSLDGLISAHPNISKEWITLIVIPVISNAAEHTTAVIVASKGKFDLAMSVAVGSCIQISLLVIPVLVLLGWIMNKPLTLLFDPLETVVLFLSVLVVKFSVEDGKSHWMSGIVLVAVYVLVAVSFWHFPSDTARLIQGQPIQCL
ncbi:hypothetical protein HYPSUDRAFT_202123 [Hypholoma sublateritium FD-334 SS-4]|uniref:Vacuolar calcium ion transporter n=1 Tax=Hypholoma sublateritium (strain FD-334 SS-4) TaxID=945553 RepID=A0A0D2NUM2_HYPSF|nr:hypothetical protein HYPSUDRAFT_202123 [Hypholoma sublateritium FD-334 SS-4]